MGELVAYVYEDVGISEAVVKASVGDACWRIIEDHVEVYRRCVTKTDFSEIPRCPSFIGDCGGIDKWWESRKNKTLAELQLEGIEWAIHLEKPKLFDSDKEWDGAKKSLAAMANEIRKSKKPILENHHISFFGK